MLEWLSRGHAAQRRPGRVQGRQRARDRRRPRPALPHLLRLRRLPPRRREDRLSRRNPVRADRRPVRYPDPPEPTLMRAAPPHHPRTARHAIAAMRRRMRSRAEALAARLELDSPLAAGRTAHLETDAERSGGRPGGYAALHRQGAVTRQPRDSVRAMFDALLRRRLLPRVGGRRSRRWSRSPRTTRSPGSPGWSAWIGKSRRRTAGAGAARSCRPTARRSSGATPRWTMTTVTSTFLPTPPPACPATRQEALR